MPNIEKSDYYYYLHKTSISDPKVIESLFNDGFKSKYGYSLHSTFYRVHEEELKRFGGDLKALFKDYIGSSGEYDSVILVKIPKMYFGEVTHRDGKTDYVMPFYREHHEDGYEWTSVLSPKLIQGVYSKSLDKPFTNPNFNPVFFPNGCQYSDEQINNMGYLSDIISMTAAKSRRRFSLAQLNDSDRLNHVWDTPVKYYTKLFGVNPTQMVHYEMPADEVKLFNVFVK